MFRMFLFVITMFVLFTAPNIVQAATTRMFNTYGGSMIVPQADVSAWEAAGWIDPSNRVALFAPDGRTIDVAKSDVSVWKAVGWYDYPVTTMSAPDGRTIVVAKSDVSAWEAVGWIDTSKTITIYAPDGRSAEIPLYQLSDYKNVGWYDYPVMYVYDSNGNGVLIAKSELSYYQSKGWSTINTANYYPVGDLPKLEKVTNAKLISSDYKNGAYIYLYSSTFDEYEYYKEYVQALGWAFYSSDLRAFYSSGVSYPTSIFYYVKDGYMLQCSWLYGEDRTGIVIRSIR